MMVSSVDGSCVFTILRHDLTAVPYDCQLNFNLDAAQISRIQALLITAGQQHRKPNINKPSLPDVRPGLNTQNQVSG